MEVDAPGNKHELKSIFKGTVKSVRFLKNLRPLRLSSRRETLMGVGITGGDVRTAKVKALF